MSSLWTPGGEHRVPDPGRAPTAAAGSPGAGEVSRAVPGGDADEAAAEQEALEQLAALEQELAHVRAADVVANHCFGLFELAAVHLRQRPPRLSDAQLAIDALGAVVEALGPRLGEAAPALVEGLSSIRLAYVQLASAPPPAAGDEAGS